MKPKPKRRSIRQVQADIDKMLKIVLFTQEQREKFSKLAWEMDKLRGGGKQN